MRFSHPCLPPRLLTDRIGKNLMRSPTVPSPAAVGGGLNWYATHENILDASPYTPSFLPVAKNGASSGECGVKIGGDSRAQAQPTGEVMTMAKPKTELGQRCPPPPYTRWDQRGKPVPLSYLKLINGERLCLNFGAGDLDIAG